MKNKTLRIDTLSKRGLPCLWENGGGATNTGDSVIVANSRGLPKKAIHINRKGHLSNGNHALIPVQVGDIVVEAYHHRRDFSVSIYKIIYINISDMEMEVSVLNHFDTGEWDIDLQDYLVAAVDAAKDKATAYHCRSPYYIKNRRTNDPKNVLYDKNMRTY